MTTKNRYFFPVFFLSAILILSFISCAKQEGCMDKYSINFDPSAEEDDGSCEYSTIVLYMKFSGFGGVPITSASVEVNGEDIGSATGFYLSDPPNCSSPGTVSYQLFSNNPVEWNAIVFLANGVKLIEHGIISPNPFEPCIKVNITKL